MQASQQSENQGTGEKDQKVKLKFENPLLLFLFYYVPFQNEQQRKDKDGPCHQG